MPFIVTVAPPEAFAWYAVWATWPAPQPPSATVPTTAPTTSAARAGRLEKRWGRAAARDVGRSPGRITGGSSFLPRCARRRRGRAATRAPVLGRGAAAGRPPGVTRWEA